MLINWFLIAAGLIVLIGGAEALVRGAGGLAMAAKISPSVVALTVVAAGTSMPELVVSAQSAVGGNPGLAMGNAVGSNLLNIGLVLGITSLVRPLHIGRNTMKFEWPVLMLASLEFYLLSRDGRIDRLEGLFMTLALAAFMAYAVVLDKRGLAEVSSQEEPETASFGRKGAAALLLNGTALIVGVACLAVGANLLVKGAVAVASGLGVSDTIIGLTVVAVGTSAPELVTSVVAAFKGRGDMAVGNVIGSCIFNLLGILGITSLISPLPVPGEILSRDGLWLLGMTAVLFPMMGSGKALARFEGVLLFGGIVFYLVRLILGA
ncbi:MAG: calcium/sodium antiporter [Spirochaetales bacterium]|nr:calcium/sodium antiporter [Spirochaetales bacterium]